MTKKDQTFEERYAEQAERNKDMNAALRSGGKNSLTADERSQPTKPVAKFMSNWIYTVMRNVTGRGPVVKPKPVNPTPNTTLKLIVGKLGEQELIEGYKASNDELKPYYLMEMTKRQAVIDKEATSDG